MRKGSTLARPLLDRMFDRISPEPNSGCWLWTGQMHLSGYGMQSVNIGNSRRVLRFVHRMVYEAHVGPIPEGLQLDHLCRVRCCVNPAHLEPVTPLENWRRGVSASAQNVHKTHCIHGHELTPDNLVPNARGTRQCRTCHVSRGRINYRKRVERARVFGVKGAA